MTSQPLALALVLGGAVLSPCLLQPVPQPVASLLILQTKHRNQSALHPDAELPAWREVRLPVAQMGQSAWHWLRLRLTRRLHLLGR